ncbi:MULTISPECIES: D-Ala-D-Ala carboxypeptidase family metallohydrolase [Acinetobacter]|nr:MULTISPECIES: D-Ala-D-Ala carboxypeptidase family metallohydrolase [Acinetobacter]EFF87525.1 hypothetical protein HMPREF0013_00723 [Acinetobacter sp. SH024]KAI0680521.1 D-Ala-D-Ala carboxypeptidase family metallohydrolase [Acinetobacter pittii]MBA0120743.1 peptidase M15 [Acinetobacter pittii]MBA0128540.1 peptidase M15 [Acinetobacter pittii]MBA0132341.1 peptidase M15 [Acinetobacter pittii]
MRKFLQSLVPLCIIPAVMVGCVSSPQHTTTGKTSPSGKRIFIPQERVIIERPIPPKVEPASYRSWLSSGENYQRVREYEKFLTRNNVAGIVPSFELLRSARDWQKCGRSEYAVPNRELWGNSLSTLRVFKYLVAAKVLTDFEVTSVYRDLPLNECAGGASSSKHLFNSAIDFRIGPEFPQAQDYAFIENTKFKLCQFWAQHGQSLNMGIGLYSSGQIHIDTQGYRTWGPDLTRNSSMCNF